VEKYSIAGQATDDNWAHAHCMLDNEGCKHTLRICYTYSFSTPTMVARTHLSVTLQVQYIAYLVVRHSQFCSKSLRSSGTWRHNKANSGRNDGTQSPSDAAPHKNRELIVVPVYNYAPGYEAIMVGGGGWRCFSRLS